MSLAGRKVRLLRIGQWRYNALIRPGILNLPQILTLAGMYSGEGPAMIKQVNVRSDSFFEPNLLLTS